MKSKSISAALGTLIIATRVIAAPNKDMASAMLRALSRTLPREFSKTNKTSRYSPPNMPPGVREQVQRSLRTGTPVKLADLQLQPPPANSAKVQKSIETKTDAWQKPVSPPRPTKGAMSVSAGTSIPARPRYIERSTSEYAVPPTISHPSAAPLNLPDAIKKSEQQALLAQTLFLKAAQGDAKSFNSLYREAWNRNVWAQYRLGICYERGIGIKQNLPLAAEWYGAAAQAGLADAQFSLAECYLSGMGVKQNVAFAVEWYRKAAAQGFAEAQYTLGTIYEKLFALGTLHEAQFGLGTFYGNGASGDNDLAIAAEWYRKAAMQGLADAQFALGEYYASGLGGLEKSDSMAVHWYKQAAEQGFADAQYALGTCYANGLGGLEKSDSLAVIWYKKAAEQGLALAQKALGDCYAKGFGVPKDASKALEWYGMASKQESNP